MASTHTLSEITSHFREELRGIYPVNEIRNIGYLVAGHLLNYSKIDFHLKDHEPISDEMAEKFLEILARLKNGEPVQYITGSMEFYGLPFIVNPDVLIPRPETEELVDWIIHENREMRGQILDIGTGSGCIAVSLSVNLPGSKVSACDISQEALVLAAQNAEKNGAAVAFFSHDVLDPSLILPGKYDVIVSNPPYVRNSEKALMHRNVLDFEPQYALFVDDEDPLLFYRNISWLARKHLADGGKIYFEINEFFPGQVMRLLQDTGFFDIEVRKDINGKARMVRGRK